MAKQSVRVETLTWTQVHAYLEKDDRVIVPIGALEQHGPHLAMGTDTLTASRVALDAGERTGVLVYPPIWYGYSEWHMAFPGTVSLRAETLQAVVEDVVSSLTVHGFRRIVLVNGHRRANLPPLQIAMNSLGSAGGRLLAVADLGYLCFQKLGELRRSSPGGIGHAGEMETSHMLYLYPEYVDMAQAVDHPSKNLEIQTSFLPSDPAHDGVNRFHLARSPRTFREATGGLGVSGSPTMATEDTGKALHEAMVDGLVRILEILRETPLPPRGSDGCVLGRGGTYDVRVAWYGLDA